MALQNQFGSEEQQSLNRDYRHKHIQAVEREKANIQKPEAEQELPEATPSAFGIGMSYLKTAYNKTRAALTDDPKVKEEFMAKERVNSIARESMKERYSWADGASDAMDLAMIVGAGVMIATGVGAAGGLALAARVATRGVAKSALRQAEKGVVSYINKEGVTKAALEMTEQVAKTPAAKEKAMEAVMAVNKLREGGAVARNIEAPLKALTAAGGGLMRNKMVIAGGVGASTALAASIGNNDLARAHREVVNNEEIRDSVRANPNKSTREILEDRNQRKFGENHVNIRKQNSQIDQEVEKIQRENNDKPEKPDLFSNVKSQATTIGSILGKVGKIAQSAKPD